MNGIVASPTHSDSAHRAAQHDTEAATTTGAWVLVAEDNPVNMEVAFDMLGQLGYRVHVATNGREAVSAAKRRQYAAILMDCHMSELDGHGATAEIRAHEGSTRHTPIIAATANTQPQDRDDAMKAGMDDFIAKPFSLDSLGKVMRRWVPSGSPHAQEPGAARASPRAVKLFFEHTPRALSELRAAVACQDGRLLKAVAHRLLGSTTVVGAPAMAQMCRELEGLADMVEESPAQAAERVEQLAAEYVRVQEVLGR